LQVQSISIQNFPQIKKLQIDKPFHINILSLIEFYFFETNMSLANKHRPQNFHDVVGQDHITEILKAKISDEKQSHHNYLFFGPRGT
jgi:hypothetical protein